LSVWLCLTIPPSGHTTAGHVGTLRQGLRRLVQPGGSARRLLGASPHLQRVVACLGRREGRLLLLAPPHRVSPAAWGRGQQWGGLSFCRGDLSPAPHSLGGPRGTSPPLMTRRCSAPVRHHLGAPSPAPSSGPLHVWLSTTPCFSTITAAPPRPSPQSVPSRQYHTPHRAACRSDQTADRPRDSLPRVPDS
jgi:hypothetical protein